MNVPRATRQRADTLHTMEVTAPFPLIRQVGRGLVLPSPIIVDRRRLVEIVRGTQPSTADDNGVPRISVLIREQRRERAERKDRPRSLWRAVYAALFVALIATGAFAAGARWHDAASWLAANTPLFHR